MKIRVCSTIIHPREVLTPSKSTPGKIYTTITPTILNDSFCDCPGFQWHGGVCTHTKEVDANQCNWYVWPAEDYAKILECPECGGQVEDFETKSEIL